MRIITAGLIVFASIGFAQAQTPQRPAVGGIGSPPDAMIFYVAHGAPAARGQACSEWITAEGTVQWDTHKRLLNILDRQAQPNLPLAIPSSAPPHLTTPTPLR